jgi:hypothetical protein
MRQSYRRDSTKSRIDARENARNPLPPPSSIAGLATKEPLPWTPIA